MLRKIAWIAAALLALTLPAAILRANLATIGYQQPLSHLWLNSLVQSTELVTDLRNFTGVTVSSADSGQTGTTVQVFGAASVGDGGAGLFMWYGSSTAADDGLNIIKPNAVSGAGRWWRMPTSPMRVATIAALKALPVSPGPALPGGFTVDVAAYALPGDMPPDSYQLAASACALNSGAGDGFTEVPSNTAGYCWLLLPEMQYDVHQAGATGSAATTGATGSDTSLMLGLAATFAAGQHIRVPQGGGAPAVTAPTGMTATTLGVTGSTTWCFRLEPFDAAEGIGVAGPEFSVTNGAATLGLGAQLHAPAQGVTLAWTAGAGQAGYIILAGNCGAETAVATVDDYLGGLTPVTTYSWTWYGHASPLPAWIPPTPLTTAQPDRLLTTITGLAGSVATISPGLSTAVSGVSVTHDDTIPLSNALASGLKLYIGAGTYYVTGTLTVASDNQVIATAGNGASTIHGYGAQDLLAVTGSQDHVEPLGLYGGDEAAGNALMLNGTVATLKNDYIINPVITLPYNGIAATCYSYDFITNPHLITEIRGNYTLHTYSTGCGSTLLYLYSLQDSDGYQGNVMGIHDDGDVHSLYLKGYTAIQLKAGPEFVTDNVAYPSSTTAPFGITADDLALNECNSYCVHLVTGTTARFASVYWQGTHNALPNIRIENTFLAAQIKDGEIFGSDHGGVDDNGVNTAIVGTVVAANSSPSNTYPDILVESDAIGGLYSDIGNIGNTSPSIPNTPTIAGIQINNGAQNVTVGTYRFAGLIGAILNYDPPANQVLIDHVPQGSPIDSFVDVSGTVALTVAAYPNAYAGYVGLLSTIHLYAYTGNFNLDLDSAANIIASLPAGVTTYRQMFEGAGAGQTTFVAGTGVTLNGTTTIPAAAHESILRHLLLQCTVTGGSTIACNGASA